MVMEFVIANSVPFSVMVAGPDAVRLDANVIVSPLGFADETKSRLAIAIALRSVRVPGSKGVEIDCGSAVVFTIKACCEERAPES